MVDWISGFLGGIQGTSEAVVEVSKERRHQIAEELKLQALEEINRRAGEREHGYAKELQGENITAQKEMSEAAIASREGIANAGNVSSEKISSERNAALERMNKLELDMKQKLLNADKKSTEAQNLRAQIAAHTEARKVIEGGGSTEEANAILETAGLPLMEEYIKEPGRTGMPVTGWFSKEPVIGRRVAGSVRGDLSTGLAQLLEMGEGSIKKSPGETGQGKNQMAGNRWAPNRSSGMSGASPEDKPKPKGILRQAYADSIPVMKQDLGDPSTWDVRMQSGQYFLMTEDGPVQMTPEQIAMWKQAVKK